MKREYTERAILAQGQWSQTKAQIERRAVDFQRGIVVLTTWESN